MNGITSDAIKRVSHDLGLPYGDSYTQDWIYELPEEYRNQEFFDKYLKAYSSPQYRDTERYLLMQLMLDITNDLLQYNEMTGKQAWNKLVNLLQSNLNLHQNQIKYWALPGELLENAFCLTPLIRSIWVE